MKYVDLSSTASFNGRRRRSVRLIISTEILDQEKRETMMARGLGLTAWVSAVFMVGVLAAPPVTDADDTKATTKSGIDAKTAFARIKKLAGTWKSQTSDEPKAEHDKGKVEDHKGESSVIYKVTGAGSALVETQFPGSGHEMVSVYHLDGEDLRMTHYCAAGNQPHVKLDRLNSKPDELIFVFDGGTNLDPQKDMHIHGLKITFLEDGKVASAWEGYTGGKTAGTTTFMMTRQQGESPAQPRRATQATSK